jgi:hypothetical protein
LHAVLDQALALLGRYITGKIKAPLDELEFQTQLIARTKEHLESLYAMDQQKRGYLKYWMTDAFDAFSRPGMEMDTDMQSWTSTCDGGMIQPRRDFIKLDSDAPLRFRFRVPPKSEVEADEVDREDDGGDEDMEVDEEEE